MKKVEPIEGISMENLQLWCNKMDRKEMKCKIKYEADTDLIKFNNGNKIVAVPSHLLVVGEWAEEIYNDTGGWETVIRKTTPKTIRKMLKLIKYEM